MQTKYGGFVDVDAKLKQGSLTIHYANRPMQYTAIFYGYKMLIFR